MSNSERMKVFIDFDGTITKEDVGALLFIKFGEPVAINKLVNQIDSGEITGNQGWKELFKLLPFVEQTKIDKMIDSVELDPYFHELIDFLRLNNIEFWILSDGFNYYINRIFNRERLDNLNIFSNTLFFDENGKIGTHYPFSDEECSDCANCKRNHILSNSADDDFTVYIGNGSSDRCPAQYCDYIFAKDTLLRFCEKERISYSPFKDFSDVILKLKQLLEKKRLKKRHQAELKRNAIYKLG